MSDQPIQLTIGHSPDPDDAFMWWPLGDASTAVPPTINTRGISFTPIAEDIEKLNHRTIEIGDLDCTALSMHCYPHVKDRYALTTCGASMGDGYGPKIVVGPDAPRDADLNWLARPDVRIAVPGLRTTAYLVLQLMLGARRTNVIAMPFDQVIPRTLAGEADAALIIHEAQVSYPEEGLRLIVDLGAWWKTETGLPLPLGANAIRRDLDARFAAGTMRRVSAVLKNSIEHAMAQRARGVDHALAYARGIPAAQADEFIALYVNQLTIDAGETGRKAVQELLDRGAAADLCPPPGRVEMVAPDAG
ncbi:MAG: MqnA/MqnD/SBP family protein [Planctomycetota bacterium]|nr:MqnA/MqnD/SBP family protein [Planctomycetota bacterium]